MKEQTKPSGITGRSEAAKAKASRPHILLVRLSEEEWQKVENMARQSGNTRSDLVRAALFRYRLRDKSEEMRQLFVHLIRGCGNLNQFLRHLNTYGQDESVMEQTLQLISWFQELRKKYAYL